MLAVRFSCVSIEVYKTVKRKGFSPWKQSFNLLFQEIFMF